MRHWKTGVGVVAGLAVSAAAVSMIRHNGGSMGGTARAETAPPPFVMPVPVVPVVKKPVAKDTLHRWIHAFIELFHLRHEVADTRARVEKTSSAFVPLTSEAICAARFRFPLPGLPEIR